MESWILITGASKGIGKAIAYEALKAGFKVVLTSRDLTTLNRVVYEFTQKGIEQSLMVAIKMDVRDEIEVNSVFQHLMKSGMIIKGIVNNAGIMKDATLQMAKTIDFLDMINTNYLGMFFVSKAALKHFLRLRTGTIVNISSIVGIHGNVGQSMYASTKSAVIGLTKSLAKELAPLNIRVNAVAPGFINTDMIKQTDDKFYHKNLNNIGMKRLGEGADVARCVLFLLQQDSQYITGQVLGVDGGMVI